MELMTQYLSEKQWVRTSEKDLLRIIEEEIGDADPKGILNYIIEATKGGKVITVGECRFKRP